jgi:hypothetical protein
MVPKYVPGNAFSRLVARGVGVRMRGLSRRLADDEQAIYQRTVGERSPGAPARSMNPSPDMGSREGPG